MSSRRSIRDQAHKLMQVVSKSRRIRMIWKSTATSDTFINMDLIIYEMHDISLVKLFSVHFLIYYNCYLHLVVLSFEQETFPCFLLDPSEPFLHSGTCQVTNFVLHMLWPLHRMLVTVWVYWLYGMDSMMPIIRSRPLQSRVSNGLSKGENERA